MTVARTQHHAMLAKADRLLLDATFAPSKQPSIAAGLCRIPVRDRRASARGAARGGLPRAPAFRDEAILCEPALCHPPPDEGPPMGKAG
jgi:hypothetical protein